MGWEAGHRRPVVVRIKRCASIRRYVAVLLGYHEIKGNVKKCFTTVQAKLLSGSYWLVLSTT